MTFFAGRGESLEGLLRKGRPLSKRRLLAALGRAKQTETSEEMLGLLKSRQLRLLLDRSLKVFGDATRRTIRLHSHLRNMQTALGILVHEGRHVLDMRAGTIPSRRKPTAGEQLLAEGRAWASELAFLARNEFQDSRRWRYLENGPREVLISIELGYGIDEVASTEFARALKDYESLFPTWRQYAL